NFPLSLSAYLDDTLRLTLAYDPTLFDRSTVERVVDRLRLLLDGLLDDPDTALDDVVWVSAAETARVVSEWNDTALPVPEVCLPELFEGQVARTPDAVAVVCGEDRLSYAELDARANRL